MSFFSSLKESLASVQQRASSLIDSNGSNSLINKGDILYITKRILTIRFPEDDATQTPTSPNNKNTRLEAISTYLDKNHHDKYLIINLSERTYNYELFHNNVIEYRFPGYPSPPLDRVLSINQSIHSWLQADSQNVVVLHCQAGKGRTVSSVAAYLAWARVHIPLADNGNVNGKSDGTVAEALTVDSAVNLVAQRLNMKYSDLIIPTQQRYIKYIDEIYNEPHIYPSSKPIVIERILMNTIPSFEPATTTIPSTSSNNKSTATSTGGQCRPYLQIFKDAKLLHTSTGRDDKLHWYDTNNMNEQSVTFAILPHGCVLYGDILIRIRHISHDTKRVSMLRFGFHTGLLPAGHLRLQKSELDGAANDSRFHDDFFIEVIYRSASQEDIDRFKASASTTADSKATESNEEHSQQSVNGIGKIVDDCKFEAVVVFIYLHIFNTAQSKRCG